MPALLEKCDEALEFLDGAVKLLPDFSLASLQHADKLRVLSCFAGLAALAASEALNARKGSYHTLECQEGVISYP